MEKTGLTEKFERAFTKEWVLTQEVERTAPAVQRSKTRQRIAKMVKDVGKSGDLVSIITVERQFLENDLAQYANSGAMANSLKTALVELSAAEKTIPLTADPVLYAAVDQSHGHPKSRKGQLPNDAARQFFSSHAARLLNQDKARLDADEKLILEARKNNMRMAEKLYIPLQMRGLGIADKPKGKGQGRGMEL